MSAAEQETENAPALSLAQESTKKDEGEGRWRIVWEVRNQGAQPLTIGAVRLPHGQFKSDEQYFTPALRLASGETARFQTAVRCHEPPGLVTENAFVIFTGDWLAVAWRIFVRIRVVVNPEGDPKTTTELITTQKIGFSDLSD